MRAVSRYAPPLAVMALIFTLSATPDLSSGLGTWDLLLRKLGHITIYAVLWLTLARAVGFKRPIAVTVVALLYACSDEYHQSLVEGRHGTPVDVAIDAFGMGLAACGWVLRTRRRDARRRTTAPLPGAPGSEPA